MKNFDEEKKKQIVLGIVLIFIILISLIVIFKKIIPGPDVYYTEENADTGYGTTIHIKEKNTKIKIDVEGAVRKPGLKVLNNDKDRIDDAIKAAGGFTKNADTSQINLAKHIFDGEKIIVPVFGEDLVIEGAENNSNETSFGIKININTASCEELQKLPGIGPTYAERIIEYRNTYGKFTEPNQLLAIKGIGEKKLEKLKDNIIF